MKYDKCKIGSEVEVLCIVCGSHDVVCIRNFAYDESNEARGNEF